MPRSRSDLPRGIQGIANKIFNVAPCTSWDMRIFRKYNAESHPDKNRLAREFRVEFDDINKLFRRRRNDLKSILTQDDIATITSHSNIVRKFADAVGCAKHQVADLIRNYKRENNEPEERETNVADLLRVE